MDNNEKALADLRRENDETLRNSDKLKTYIIAILLVICGAFGGSSCTVWVLQDDVVVNKQNIAVNRLQNENMNANMTEVKASLYDITTRLTALGNTMSRVEEAIK